MHFPKNCALNLLLCLPLLACTADKEDDTDTNATPATATDGTSSAGTGTSTGGTTAGTTADADTTATAPTTGSDTTEGAMTATSDMTGATSDMTGATSDMTGATSIMSGSTTSDDTTGDDTSTGADTSTGEPAGLSYAVDVHPVVIANTCGCHGMGSGGLKFTDAASAYAAFVNVASFGSSLDHVEPGDPDKSYVLQKMLGNQVNVGMGQNMPLGGAMLSQDKLDLFEQWILEGAAP